MRKTRNNDFLKGTVSLSVSVILTKLLGVGFKVPLSYVLGDAGMGYFNTAYAIYGFFYILCTAGVPKSIMLVLSGYHADNGDDVSDEYVVKCGLRLFFKIGLFSSLLNIICAPVFARFVGNTNAALSILAVAPSILFVSLSGVLRGYLNSRERLTVIAASQVIEGVVKLLLGLAFSMIGVKIGAAISTIAALGILGITSGSFISFIFLYIRSKNPNKENNRRQKSLLNSKTISKSILKNSLPIALSASLLNLSSTLDLAIIIKGLVASGMSEDYANSIYGNYTTLAVPMFTLIISVLTPLATSYMPRLSESYARGDKEKYSESLKQLFIITVLISVPASLGMYFYSFDLLDVLFSVQSSALGAEMLIWLSLGICFLAVLTVINTALEAKGKIFATVVSLLIGAAVKVAVTYALIRTSYGVNAAPIGSVVSYFISLVISLFALEMTDTRINALLRLGALYSVGIVSFYIPYEFIYRTNMFSSSFLSMLLSGGISVTLYLIFLILAYALFLRKKCVENKQKSLFAIR